jgi:hypothetical protein
MDILTMAEMAIKYSYSSSAGKASSRKSSHRLPKCAFQRLELQDLISPADRATRTVVTAGMHHLQVPLTLIIH